MGAELEQSWELWLSNLGNRGAQGVELGDAELARLMCVELDQSWTSGCST